jgi:heme exporter protein B
MTRHLSSAHKVWCLVRKDFRRESRAPLTWPAGLLFGLVMVLTLDFQMDLPEPVTHRVAGGLLWLSVFFAGTVGVQRSFDGEQEHDCWTALRMYPVSPSLVFMAKMLFNLMMLCCVTGLLIPSFVVLGDVPLLARPGPTMLVALLADLGLAAIGTLVGGLTIGLQRRGNLIALLLLPLVLPVVLAAGEGTRLAIVGDLGDSYWRWVQLLAAFDVAFFTLGVLLFEFVMED